MLSPFSILKEENSKFKSLDVWRQLKKRSDNCHGIHTKIVLLKV